MIAPSAKICYARSLTSDSTTNTLATCGRSWKYSGGNHWKHPPRPNTTKIISDCHSTINIQICNIMRACLNDKSIRWIIGKCPSWISRRVFPSFWPVKSTSWTCFYSHSARFQGTNPVESLLSKEFTRHICVLNSGLNSNSAYACARFFISFWKVWIAYALSSCSTTLNYFTPVRTYLCIAVIFSNTSCAPILWLVSALVSDSQIWFSHTLGSNYQAIFVNTLLYWANCSSSCFSYPPGTWKTTWLAVAIVHLFPSRRLHHHILDCFCVLSVLPLSSRAECYFAYFVVQCEVELFAAGYFYCDVSLHLFYLFAHLSSSDRANPKWAVFSSPCAEVRLDFPGIAGGLRDFYFRKTP